jgi:hypothetical protein
MKKNIDDEKCFHCNQVLTLEAREYIEKTGGLLPTPEQIEAKNNAEAKRIQKEIDQGVETGLKEKEKSPEQIEAEEIALTETMSNKRAAGVIEGQKLSEEEINIKNKKISIFEQQNRENHATIKSLKMKLSNTKGDSPEMKGNLQHKNISEILQECYKEDIFKDFSIGEPGSDILQTVIRNGKECGKILWESKRLEPHQSFNQAKFIPKLLREKVEFEAFTAAFVTNKFPVGKDKESGIELIQDQVNYIEKHGFYYCPMDKERILLLCGKLRAEAIANSLDMIPNNKNEVKDKLYNLLRGPKAKAVADLVNRKSDQLAKTRNAIVKKAALIASAANDMITSHDESHKLSREIIDEHVGLINEANKITGQDLILINHDN